MRRAERARARDDARRRARGAAAAAGARRGPAAVTAGTPVLQGPCLAAWVQREEELLRSRAVRTVILATMRRATSSVLRLLVLAMLPAAGWALDNGVGRTPMMGWMAWIRFRCNIACDADPDNCISERLVKSMADAMVAGGYKDAGYEYVSIDDCWQAHERTPDGTIQPNSTRFPSGMKALGDYIHARGLKFGLYTAMGKTTCQGYPALGVRSVDDMGYAKRDVETFVSWGIDYIKVDSCGGAQPSQFNTTHPLLSSWFLEAAQAAGRPVLYHPSGIALADGVDAAGSSAGEIIAAGAKGVKQYRLFAKVANMWRTFADMQPIWSEVQAIIDYWAADDPETHPRMYPNEFADFLAASRPGAVQDPDALLVGNVRRRDHTARARLLRTLLCTRRCCLSHDTNACTGTGRQPAFVSSVSLAHAPKRFLPCSERRRSQCTVHVLRHFVASRRTDQYDNVVDVRCTS